MQQALRRINAVQVLVIVGIVALLIALILPSIQRYRQLHERPCWRQVGHIGRAILLYTIEHDGKYPDKLEDLLEYVAADVFVCPRSGDTPARGATTREMAAEISAAPRPEDLAPGFKGRGHRSYIYVGRGMGKDVPPTTVVLYERLENHKEGMNVLFGDGHVEFIDSRTAAKMLAELNAGHNPPRAEKMK